MASAATAAPASAATQGADSTYIVLYHDGASSADAAATVSNAGGSYLGDSRFDPIFAELQRRAALVFVHPIASPDPIAHTLGLPDTLLDYPVDTSRAIDRMRYIPML